MLSRSSGTESIRKRIFNLLPIGLGIHSNGKMDRIRGTNGQEYNII